MSPAMKYGLAIGGGLLALKLYDDSKKLAAVIRAKNSLPPSTTNIGGNQIPVPVESAASPQLGPVNTEAGLANANPDTAYGAGYM